LLTPFNGEVAVRMGSALALSDRWRNHLFPFVACHGYVNRLNVNSCKETLIKIVRLVPIAHAGFGGTHQKVADIIISLDWADLRSQQSAFARDIAMHFRFKLSESQILACTWACSRGTSFRLWFGIKCIAGWLINMYSVSCFSWSGSRTIGWCHRFYNQLSQRLLNDCPTLWHPQSGSDDPKSHRPGAAVHHLFINRTTAPISMNPQLAWPEFVDWFQSRVVPFSFNIQTI
jgi:hypothetical protein